MFLATDVTCLSKSQSVLCQTRHDCLVSKSCSTSYNMTETNVNVPKKRQNEFVG